MGHGRGAVLNVCLIKAENNACPWGRSQISQFLTSLVSCNHLMISDFCFFILTKPSDPSENLHDFCIIVSDVSKWQKKKTNSESSTLQYQAIISQYTQLVQIISFSNICCKLILGQTRLLGNSMDFSTIRQGMICSNKFTVCG